MTVPFSDDVASSVPVELMERKERGALCAWMTLATVSERVENKRTSPDWFCEAGAEDVDAAAGAPAADGAPASGEVGEGTGEGYAR